MNFSVLLIFASMAICAHCVTMGEQKQMLLGIAQECKAIEDASDDDLSKLVEKKPPVSKQGKCLFACIMENMDIVSWNFVVVNYSVSNSFFKLRCKTENWIKLALSIMLL